ncbi:MAG: GntR family transcriptional regulator [Actinoallomurus sp.]
MHIAEVLRQRIVGGYLAPGSPIPSEAALCKEFSVVRNTIRRALTALEDEKLIETLPGKGRVVRGALPTQYEHGRITADLRQQIECGNLAPGDVLPSEAALIERYQVSRGTARQALAALEAAGLIETRHGKGRFVLRHP